MAAPVPVPIDQRFAQLIRQFGLTKNSFAISLGKTASVVQHLIDGRNKPGYDLLCKVFEIYPNVSRDWLLLGRGPMLVGGEPAPKPLAQATAAAPPFLPEELDFSEIEVPSARRPGPGVAGSRLQPADIAATLALATAAAQPVRTVAAPPEEMLPAAPVGSAPPAAAAPPAAVEMPAAPAAAPLPVPAPSSASASSIAEPERPAPAPAPAAFSPESYVAGALHAQHLQHQLALAELRNQHLLEQQQMLREMLAMARQAMV